MDNTISNNVSFGISGSITGQGPCDDFTNYNRNSLYGNNGGGSNPHVFCGRGLRNLCQEGPNCTQ